MRRLVLAAVAAAALAPVPALAGECDLKGDVRCARSCSERLDPAEAVAYASDLVACLT